MKNIGMKMIAAILLTVVCASCWGAYWDGGTVSKPIQIRVPPGYGKAPFEIWIGGSRLFGVSTGGAVSINALGPRTLVVDANGTGAYKTIAAAMAAIPDQSALPCWDNDWIKTTWTLTGDATTTSFTNQPTLPIQITIDPGAAPGTTAGWGYSFVITGKNASNATITETLTWSVTSLHGMQITGQYFKSVTSIAYTGVAGATEAGATVVGVGLQVPTYTVLVTPGVYHEQVTVKQFVTLQGLDRDGCVIEYGRGVADTANEYVVNIQKDAVCENLTIVSGHQYGDTIDNDEYTSPIVGMGIPSTDVAPDRATLRNCTLKAWHQLQFGVNAGWVSGTRAWYSCTDVCIEDNVIEGAAEQLLAVYFAKKLRFTGNKFAGCGSYTFAQVGLADIGGVAGSPTDCASEWLIANNSGTIETKAFNYVHNGSMNFLILRGWGHQIVNNSVTMIMTGEGTADYTAQVNRIAGVTLGLMWATPVTNKQQQSVVTGNNVTWIYRRSHSNFTQAAIVYGEDNGSNTPVYLANNTWTIIQAPGRNGLPAMSQTIPDAKKFRIYGNTGAASVVTIGPNAFQGYSKWTEDTTLDYREEPIANWIDSLASMTVRGGNDAGVYCDTLTVTTAAENTYVAANMPITIPAKSFLRGIIIQSGAPGGTATGTKTIQYAVGSVANANIVLTDATDCDILAATAALTAANVHGDVVADYKGPWWEENISTTYYPAAVRGGFVQNQTRKIPLFVNGTADTILTGAAIVAETLPTGGTLACTLYKRASGGTETALQSGSFDPEDAGVLDALTPYTLANLAVEATRTLAANDTVYLWCVASDAAVTDWGNVTMTLGLQNASTGSGHNTRSKYFAADTIIYLNYLGKSVNPSYGNGTVTAAFNVRLLLERLP